MLFYNLFMKQLSYDRFSLSCNMHGLDVISSKFPACLHMGVGTDTAAARPIIWLIMHFVSLLPFQRRRKT